MSMSRPNYSHHLHPYTLSCHLIHDLSFKIQDSFIATSEINVYLSSFCCCCVYVCAIASLGKEILILFALFSTLLD